MPKKTDADPRNEKKTAPLEGQTKLALRTAPRPSVWTCEVCGMTFDIPGSALVHDVIKPILQHKCKG